MRAVLMSPTSFASLRMSILSDASTLPWMVPSTTTSRAFTPACSLPFGPTVKRCSCSSTEPSISPSIVRSSRLKIWPLIMTDFPMIAGPRDSEAGWLGVGLLDIGMFSLAWLAVGAGAAAGLGGYSSSFRLFHIKDDLLRSFTADDYCTTHHKDATIVLRPWTCVIHLSRGLPAPVRNGRISPARLPNPSRTSPRHDGRPRFAWDNVSRVQST